MGVCWLDKEETRPGERRQGTRSRGYKSRLGRIPAGQAAEGCDHDPHPAQPVCWSGNLSQHPDFLVSSPPCLGEDPENRANAGRMQIIWPHLLPWVPPPPPRPNPGSHLRALGCSMATHPGWPPILWSPWGLVTLLRWEGAKIDPGVGLECWGKGKE